MGDGVETWETWVWCAHNPDGNLWVIAHLTNQGHSSVMRPILPARSSLKKISLTF
jgi:hypothetical protein